MICQVCGKNEATVEFTEIIDDEVKQLHLCAGCAKEKGIEMEQNFSISDLLAGISGLGEKPSGGEPLLKCGKCGMTYTDFQKIGRLGCGECYSAFRTNLLPLLKRIHGSTRHIGKSPKEIDETDGKKKISEAQELRQKLQRAIDMEEFEEAARLRDRIRALEKKAKDKP
ncbi:MAG: UvrB/UvrC motif-containing protein [Candidatus Omnitrophica bacterium]|nr:UvrB/UvrC motif-containing protein [Candidatus Omnitrophota bacterium]MDD5311015.1 UvrB/UvrC motif-containing protein [Candidatus Omnitrophota bacterium]MDD5546561.1 UvrB/UvrC motif-containing protein [Candidatus Omnitrophota bacterium]